MCATVQARFHICRVEITASESDLQVFHWRIVWTVDLRDDPVLDPVVDRSVLNFRELHDRLVDIHWQRDCQSFDDAQGLLSLLEQLFHALAELRHFVHDTLVEGAGGLFVLAHSD